MSVTSLLTSARARLMTSASGGVSRDAVEGHYPKFVTDFANGRYSSLGNGVTTFSSALTHAATSNATMTGLRKWALHNLLTYSEQFDNAAWTVSADGTATTPVVTANTSTAPDGSLTADRLQLSSGASGNAAINQTVSPIVGAVYTFGVWMRSRSGSSVTVTMFNNSAVENKTVTTSWQLFTFEQAATLTTDTVRIAKRNIWSSGGDADLDIWGAHLYRSDRGGMVTASDGSTYLATTGTAVEPVRVDAEGGVGEVCWRPHNFLTYSEDITAGGWTELETSFSAGSYGGQSIVENSALNAEHVAQQVVSFVSGAEYTFTVKVKRATGTRNFRLNAANTATFALDVYFNLSDGSIIAEALGSGSVSGPDADGFYTLTATGTAGASASTNLRLSLTEGGDPTYDGDGVSSVEIKEPHLYRSDLGGMVNNPDTGDSYVPTTSAAVYLPRTGHHIYKPEEGAIVGAELVTNGTFDSDSGWTPAQPTSGSVTISGGVGEVESLDGSYAALTQTISVENGKVYKVSFDITLDAGKAEVGIGGDAYSFASNITTSGSYETFWVADRASFPLEIKRGSSATFPTTFSIDNISVREVNPWVNEGLLLESEARTNGLINSNSFGAGTGWSTWGADVTVTDNAAIGADGETSLSLFTPLGAGAGRIEYHDGGAASIGDPYTASVDLKAGTSAASQIRLYETVAGNSFVVGVTWASGTPSLAISGNTMGSATLHPVQPLGGGLYRVAITAEAASANLVGFAIIPDTSAGGGTIYVGGAQLEIAPTPSSYIPTAGSTATRDAETLTVPAANLPWPTPQVIGPELLGTGAVSTLGSPSVAGSYNTSTGVGQSTRTDASNGASVAISVTTGSVYLIDVENTDGADVLQIRASIAGVIFGANISSGSRVTRYVVGPSSGEIHFSAGGNGVEVDFTLHEFKEINPLAVSIQMDGRVTYADTDDSAEVVFWRWRVDSSDQMRSRIDTSGALVGRYITQQTADSVYDQATDAGTEAYADGILVPFSIASRHGSTFINGAADGTAYVENITPVALPDLSATDMDLGETYMGTIKQFRVWATDLGDTGIEDASA